MARAYAACFVIALAIVTPGIVVAATSSGGGGNALFGGTSVTASITVSPTVIDPALRPSVRAMTRAFAARGIHLALEPSGPNDANLAQVGSSGDCRVFIVFHDSRGELLTYSNSCGTGELRAGQIEIVYSPPSVGPTIVQAVAGLPR